MSTATHPEPLCQPTPAAAPVTGSGVTKESKDDPCLEGSVWDTRQVGKRHQEIRASRVEPSRGRGPCGRELGKCQGLVEHPFWFG